MVNYTHFTGVVVEDFEEVTHDVREEGNTTQHHNEGTQSFDITDWIKVSIADGGENGQGEVHRTDKLREQ